MKKPFMLQYIFAKPWLWFFAFWICPVIIASLLIIKDPNDPEGFMDYVKMIFAAVTCGFLVSYFPSFVFARILMQINGSSYHEGDMVHILVGKHKGKIARVYDIWDEQKTVRVDVDEQSKRDVKDVFSYLEVCRAT